MEDNLLYARGRQVAHNAELVTRAAELAALMQRPAMSPEGARALLRVKERRAQAGPTRGRTRADLGREQR